MCTILLLYNNICCYWLQYFYFLRLVLTGFVTGLWASVIYILFVSLRFYIVFTYGHVLVF